MRGFPSQSALFPVVTGMLVQGSEWAGRFCRKTRLPHVMSHPNTVTIHSLEEAIRLPRCEAAEEASGDIRNASKIPSETHVKKLETAFQARTV
jgi:hypothetical protein